MTLSVLHSFAFSKGEDISTHDLTGDAMVTVIEGWKFIVDDKEYIVNQGESLCHASQRNHTLSMQKHLR